MSSLPYCIKLFISHIVRYFKSHLESVMGLVRLLFLFHPLTTHPFLHPKSSFYVLPCAFSKLNDIKPISNNGTIYFPTAWNIISLFKQCDPLNYSSIDDRSTQNSFVSFFFLKRTMNFNSLSCSWFYYLYSVLWISLYFISNKKNLILYLIIP